MNVDKLVEAIQIIVKEEVKKERVKLMKEFKEEMRKLKLNQPTNQPTIKPLSKSNHKVSITEVLNETAQSYSGAPKEAGYEEWPTMSNPAMVNTVMSNRSEGFDRTSLAAKMGYGDMGRSGASPSGLGVDTGNPALNKALNRDYTELIKIMDNRGK
jgi:hypothetical protein